MATLLLPSAYLAPVSFYALIAACDTVRVEQCDHYVKQTYRNRCVIAAESGPLSLTVPTEKSITPKCCMSEVRISDHGNWRHLHWNAIESAYKNSPFYDYYQDDFLPFYRENFPTLLDYNQQLCLLVCDLIGLHPSFSFTSEYNSTAAGDITDCRIWIEPGCMEWRERVKVVPYYQVFASRMGFQENMSILDLLFNMGPESILVLQQMNERL